MGLGVDGSTPAFVTGTSNPCVTASFSPPADSVLFGFTIADELNTFSLSGGGLTWVQIQPSLNVSARCSLSIWRAYAATAPGSMTVSSTRTGSFNAHALKVVVFTGAEATFSGASGRAASNTVTITATRTGSQVWGVLGDELGATNDAAGSGCTWNDAEALFGGISGGILRRTTADSVAGSGVTISAGSAATDMSIASVEVKPAPLARSLIVPQSIRRAAYV